MRSLKEYLEKVASMVDGYIYAIVQGKPQQLYDAALHLIRAGGKRLRPLIVVAVAEMLEEQAEKALPFAAAVELVHNFTLIHDDIMDRDEYRRGVPTVHKLWGEPMAITAGDLLFAKAFEVVSSALDKGVPPENVAEAARVLARATSIIAEGQAMDMMFEDRDDVTLEEYLDMIYRKTGALFEASAVLGGLVATTDKLYLSRLADFGRNLGIAFQIKDDILGLIGSEEKLGKPVYSDIREGKKTVLVIYALEHLDDQDREKLLSILGDREATREELEEAAALIKKTGAVEYAEELAKDYAEKARQILLDFPDNEARNILLEVVDFIVAREK
ncbi:MAG: polyprenyl synthetase family protein [Pyrodictiaceae archaeon]